MLSPVIGGVLFRTPRLLLQQMVLDCSILPPGGGGEDSGSGRCRRAFSPLICVYLTAVEEPHVVEKESGVGGRCCPLSVWMFAPQGHRDRWALPRGGKSLHAAARSRIPAKFGRFLQGLSSPSPHTCAFLSPIAGLRFVRRHAGET